MAAFNEMSVGYLRMTPMTVNQVNAIPNPSNGCVAFCTNEGTSGACLVAYQDTAWVVVETGAAMAA